MSLHTCACSHRINRSIQLMVKNHFFQGLPIKHSLSPNVHRQQVLVSALTALHQHQAPPLIDCSWLHKGFLLLQKMEVWRHIVKGGALLQGQESELRAENSSGGKKMGSLLIYQNFEVVWLHLLGVAPMDCGWEESWVVVLYLNINTADFLRWLQTS